MKKIFVFLFVAALSITGLRAQTIANDFNRNDCNGVNRHLFADLDSGKAVILFYFMPSCGSCPPPAKKIQTMANNLNAAHPGSVKGYAFPYQDVTPCSYTTSWISSNALPFYNPMDSGSTDLTHYGGFGMPTVILVGGSNHRMIWNTLSFNTSDTTIMRDSILNLLGFPIPGTGLHEAKNELKSLNIFPNPVKDVLQVEFTVVTPGHLNVEVADMSGKSVATLFQGNADAGKFRKEFDTSTLPAGNYLIHIRSGSEKISQSISVLK